MSPRPPRHLADDDAPTPWWGRLNRRRLVIAIGTTLLALPILVVDNLPTGPNSAEAVETAGAGPEATTSTVAPHPTTTTVVVTTTTAAPTVTTAPPATTTTTPRPTPTTATTAPPRRTVTTAPPTTTATTAAPHVQTLAPATTATTGNTQSGKATFYYWNPGECAHRTLPKGTLVTITNVATGASTTCTVTDRGPYGAGRIIDLDSTVFDDIAPLSQGVIDVVISW